MDESTNSIRFLWPFRFDWIKKLKPGYFSAKFLWNASVGCEAQQLWGGSNSGSGLSPDPSSSSSCSLPTIFKIVFLVFLYLYIYIFSFMYGQKNICLNTSIKWREIHLILVPGPQGSGFIFWQNWAGYATLVGTVPINRLQLLFLTGTNFKIIFKILTRAKVSKINQKHI